MVRRYEQGEQLPLFVGSRSSLVFFGEEQYRDYGTHRTQGLDSMVRVVWCDDLNRGSRCHFSRSSLALVHPDLLLHFETRT